LVAFSGANRRARRTEQFYQKATKTTKVLNLGRTESSFSFVTFCLESSPPSRPRKQIKQKETKITKDCLPANHANKMTELIYKRESYAIIGACFEVYNDKGCGFLEPVYQDCPGIEFEYQRIPAIAKPSLTLSYRGRILRQTYEPDYVCFEKIMVELKSVSTLADEHRAQLLNYLQATGFELGLLVNFGHYPKLEYERLAKTQRIKGETDFSDVSLSSIRVYSRD
jgi:GxxExxY protein